MINLQRETMNQDSAYRFFFVDGVTLVNIIIIIKFIVAAVIVVNNFACVRTKEFPPPYMTDTTDIR